MRYATVVSIRFFIFFIRLNGVETTFRKSVWPPDDGHPAIVTHDDLKSLEPGEQLSINIVNFYLK